MIFLDQVEQQLSELVSSNHCGAGTVNLSFGGRNVRCRLRSVDRLACELEMCQVTGNVFQEMTPKSLEDLANRLCEKLSYLEERIVLVEKDSELLQAQLRSQQPCAEESKRAYFEIMLGKNGMSLQRYEKPANGPRQPIPAVVGRKLLGRLCSDLAEIA